MRGPAFAALLVRAAAHQKPRDAGVLYTLYESPLQNASAQYVRDGYQSMLWTRRVMAPKYATFLAVNGPSLLARLGKPGPA